MNSSGGIQIYLAISVALNHPATIFKFQVMPKSRNWGSGQVSAVARVVMLGKVKHDRLEHRAVEEAGPKKDL